MAFFPAGYGAGLSRNEGFRCTRRQGKSESFLMSNSYIERLEENIWVLGLSLGTGGLVSITCLGKEEMAHLGGERRAGERKAVKHQEETLLLRLFQVF